MSKKDAEDGPFKIPEQFGKSEDELPREETGERIKRALEEGAVEVSEEKRSHTFVRRAAEDTGDEAWGGGIIGAMYGADDPSEEVSPPEGAGGAETSKTPAPAGPDLLGVGSVDSNNPITFIDSPLGDDLLATPPEPAPPPEEPEADPPSDPGGEAFLADLGLMDEPMPLVDPPEPAASEPPPEPVANAPVDFFSGAPQPPTEEVPSAIFDDVSQPSAIPSMSGGVGYEEVPQPRMEEVVIGAPTPPPAVRESAPGEPMPDLRQRLKARADARAAEADDDDEGMGLPVLPILVLVALLMALSGAGYFLYSLASGPDAKRAEQAAISGEERPHVGLPAVTLPDVMQEGPREIPDEGWTDAMAVPVEVEEATAPRKPAPPVRAERPAPKTGLAALTARITVTSNRRAMIALDGTPQGYAPLDIRVVPGEYTLTATIPGRGDTEQSKQVTVGEDQTQSIGFVF